MKKTIQINIAGIVFNIEEDAFETLNAYLSSIQNYFSGYESSEEIVADIEARIAEKFIGKHKADDLPIIGVDEVEKVMTSMGTVADFEAIEDDETDAFQPEPKKKENYKNTQTRRIYRDGKRKALGGVLAGLANHFNVDVVWFRVIFLVCALGLIEVGGLGGIFIVAYIICWIAFPVSNNLAEQENIKKFYRNGENKVVAGVASGLSAYFNVDVALIRVLFVAGLLFFGVGLVAYLVLWVASPIAERLTQKMEMKGEAVTIENIDSNIKQNLGTTPNSNVKRESAIATLLLLPFRILGKLFQGIGHLLSKLGPVIRVFIGIGFTLTGLMLTLGAIVATAAFFGVLTNHHWFNQNDDFGLFTRDLSPSAGIFLFLTIALPAIGMMMSGIFLISNQRVGNRNFWLTGLGLWLLGIVGLAIYGGKYSMNYAKNASVVETETYEFQSDVIYLETYDNYDETDFDFNSQVRIRRSSDNQVSLERRLSASGRTREIAKQNAETLTFNVNQRDSILVFDERAVLNPETGFRNQKVHVELLLPVGQKIHMSNEFARTLLANSWSLKSKYGLGSNDFASLIFTLNENGDLECLECEVLDEDAQNAYEDSDHQEFYDNDRDFERIHTDHVQNFDLEGFKGIEVGGTFHVLINQGDKYDIEFMAEREKDIEDLNVRLNGSELDIDFRDRFFRNRGKVLVYITMPNLESLDISGASKMKVLGFENVSNLDVDISGASNAKLDIEAKNLKVDASGASKLEVRGRVDDVELDISGASRFNAKRAEINRARVDANGASHADFGKVEDLQSNTSGASHVNAD